MCCNIIFSFFHNCQAWILFVIWGLFYPLYTVVALKSSISKMLKPGEIGKVFAALGVLGKDRSFKLKRSFLDIRTLM